MRRNTMFWGLVLVLVGGLVLLGELGVLRVDVWGILWPSFLILLGLSMLWSRVINPSPVEEHINIPLEGASRARLHLQHRAGRLAITSGAAAGDLLEGSFEGGVDFQTRRQGDQLNVGLRIPSRSFPIFWGSNYSLDWDVSLTPQVLLTLE